MKQFESILLNSEDQFAKSDSLILAKIETGNKVVTNYLNQIKILIASSNMDLRDSIKKIQNFGDLITKKESLIEQYLKEVSSENKNIFDTRWAKIIDRLEFLNVLSNSILVNSSEDVFYYYYKEIEIITDMYNVTLDKYFHKQLIYNVIDKLKLVGNVTWNSDNTYKDVYNRSLQDVQKINSKVELKFIDINLEQNLLVRNDIKIKVIFERIEELLEIKINNIIHGTKDAWKIISTIFKTPVNWKLDETNKYNEVLKLIEATIYNKINTITIKCELPNRNLDDFLLAGDNRLIMTKININKQIFNLDVMLLKIDSKLDKINFDQMNKIIKFEDFDNKNYTYQNIFDEIKIRLTKLEKKLTFDMDSYNLRTWISWGDTPIKIKVYYGDQFKEIQFTIKMIKWERTPLENQVLKELYRFFNQQKLDWNLFTNNTYNDLLNRLKQEIKLFLNPSDYNQIKNISFVESYDMKKVLHQHAIDLKYNFHIKIKFARVDQNFSLSLKNINFSKEDMVKSIKNYFEKEHNLYLTTEETGGRIIERISTNIIDHTTFYKSELERITYELYNESKNTRNSFGTKNWKINVKIDNISIGIMTLKLKGITWGFTDINEKLTTFFSRDYDWNLNQNNTERELLELIIQKVKNFFGLATYDRSIKVELEDPNNKSKKIKDMWGYSNNKISINLKILVKNSLTFRGVYKYCIINLVNIK